MRPVFIPPYIQRHLNSANNDDTINSIKTACKKLLKGKPEISIVIPAYNEEATILPTLSSLSHNITGYSVEIVVVNNNSKDNTENLVKACGITCITETKQGIVHARNAGLAAAKGKYILNADADSIYPEYWIDEMVKPLIKHENIAITYGPFSFIPVGNTGRVTYFFYEYLADLSRLYDKYMKDEAVNVYGFTSAMRREPAIAVDGFTFPKGAGEDGYLALKLRDGGYGKLYRVRSKKAIAWTTDRRIQIDGGLFKGLKKRFKRVLNIK
jgi:glycosyltransferase involved in cell wall biosynthesis